MKKNFSALGLAIVSAAMLSGCVAYGEAYIPAPPPPQAEVIIAAPYPEAIWVPGYWGWHQRHRRYIWVPGSWKGRGHGHQYDHRR